MLTIDLNCDLGEGMPHDAALMPYISSANIACGGHAGDKDTMRRTIELALKYGVAIGAHPSFPDRDNFGRKDWIGTKIRPEDIPAIISEQFYVLSQICDEFKTTIRHVKPHGALYNRAARDGMVSSFICKAMLNIDAALFLYGLSGSEMQKEATLHNLSFVSEVFADRSYEDDGSLTPRDKPGALIEDEDQSLDQVMQMIRDRTVSSLSGKQIPIDAKTVCLHGDGKMAVEFAKLIHAKLTTENIVIKAPG